MSVIQIPNLPAAIALTGTEQLEIVQAGVSCRTTTGGVAGLNTPAISALQSDVSTLQSDVSTLQSDVSALQTGLSNLKTYGSFISSVTQTNTGPTAVRLMYFDTTPVASSGVTLASNGTNLSRMTVAYTGVYNIMFSAQILTSSGGSQSAFIWLRINGSNVVASNTEFSIAKNNANLVAAWNWMVPLTAGQYVEIAWESADANLTLVHSASPTYGPAIPSIIATINAVG